MGNASRPLPFSPFEWLLSGRYLQARRKEGFISVIAGFSFLGIMLGVATLIIVMAVMNGFRKELIDRIVGMNGHLAVQPIEAPLTDWADVTERIRQVPGIRLAVPVVDGPALASSAHNASGVLVRGIRPDRQARFDRRQHPAGLAGRLCAGARGRHRTPACRSIVAACRRQHHAGLTWRIVRDVKDHCASHEALQGRCGIQHRHVGI